jgi:two-component system chemotaxis response regulator CheY
MGTRVKRVLVVEDSPVMRQLLVFAVESYGEVHVSEASDGVAALKAIRAADAPFDLILLDLNMPIMDGVKLLGYLQNEVRAENTVVAVVTTESDVELERQCRELGAQYFLRKPVTKAQLTPILRSVLA